MERAGLTTALITSLPLVATAVGATRVVQGSGIDHPVGKPGLPLDREQEWRRGIVEAALQAIETEVAGPTLFQPTNRVPEVVA
ncbi:MAG: hypothetical protein HY690_15135 [Chloroflexi bacterium]|nr:hypothetical protein [Chloroflexota bacterium]